MLRLLQQVLLVLVRLQHHLVQLRILALVELHLRLGQLAGRYQLVEEGVCRRAGDVGDVRRVHAATRRRTRRKQARSAGVERAAAAFCCLLLRNNDRGG
eukprot:5133929-Prymnesium_polylepis.2